MKLVTAADAAQLLCDDWTLAASGVGGFGHPEAITDAVEKRFLATELPRNLSRDRCMLPRSSSCPASGVLRSQRAGWE